MSVMIALEIVIGAVLALVLIVLGLIFARRRALARHGNLIVAGVRVRSHKWHIALVKLEGDRLESHPLLGVRVSPKRVWRRAGLLLEVPEPLDDAGVLGVLPDASRVRCRAAEGDFELALQPSAYTAVRSWVEACPPGVGVNVA